MRAGLISAIATAACLLSTGASPASAAVDLVFRPEPQTVPVGARIELGLYAVSDDGSDLPFSAADVGFTWDPTVLSLVDATPGPHSWSMSGFLPDSNLDGINDSLGDGDARYTVLAFTPAVATAEGFLVATFRFDAVTEGELTEVVIELSLGEYSATRVFGTGEVNEDVTGLLGSAGLTLVSEASLSVADLTIAAGRTASVIASGEIVERETAGVTVVVTLTPRDENEGTVKFTLAPPTDIEQLGDPWPLGGLFSPFDTDVIPLEPGVANGIVDENGSGVPDIVTYTGLLASFPVAASSDAHGVWDIRLEYFDEIAGRPERSTWQGVATGMRHAVLKVVDLGDGDGNASIEFRDFFEFQACFTGPVGPIDPPGYSQAPAMRCGVYDFDGDGDIDAGDYSDFHATMFGPVP